MNAARARLRAWRLRQPLLAQATPRFEPRRAPIGCEAIDRCLQLVWGLPAAVHGSAGQHLLLTVSDGAVTG